MNNLFFAHQKSLDITRRHTMQTFLMLQNKGDVAFFNPNDEHHAIAVASLQRHEGFADDYFKGLVKICDSVVFTSYDGKTVAADVAQYVQTHLDHKGRNARCSEILFQGNAYMLKPVRSLDGYAILSPEETLERESIMLNAFGGRSRVFPQQL